MAVSKATISSGCSNGLRRPSGAAAAINWLSSAAERIRSRPGGAAGLRTIWTGLAKLIPHSRRAWLKIEESTAKSRMTVAGLHSASRSSRNAAMA